jgi:Cd2+/Zn2+-exporting ATPase/Cu+-exporting ATPase
MAALQTIEVSIKGMDCTECTQHVKHAIANIKGVEKVDVLLASEKAIVTMDPAIVKMPLIAKAVTKAGYSVNDPQAKGIQTASALGRKAITVLSLVIGLVLFVIVLGEGFGLFNRLTNKIPFVYGAIIVIIGGLPVFIDVIRSALQKQITSRTLMSLGVIAALVVGQWTTAGVVVFMMHIGNFIENFTTERSRKAIKDLGKMLPAMAHVERGDVEMDVPIGEVKESEIVVIRPGETIPVDGQVISGNAAINQASVTGESMPVDVAKGSKVYAATVSQSGSIRIQTTHTGRSTTFGKVIQLVEEAEARKGDYQRFADKFSGYYLPVVAGIALLTWIISGHPLFATAVLVVACSCSIALATPIATLASIGAAARQGIVVKGGKYLEMLATAKVVLIDKTGTITLGKPRITKIIPMNGTDENTLLILAASAERFSEHPLSQALRDAAADRDLQLKEVGEFEAFPGMGIQASIEGHTIRVGNDRLLDVPSSRKQLKELSQSNGTKIFMQMDGKIIGGLVAEDTIRQEVPLAIKKLQQMGISTIELLTGDNESSAAEACKELGISYHANLLPEDKIRIVKEYQSKGQRVVMIGDGINDAPALAQADIGIAMGSRGTDIALETANVALMREDWNLIPALIHSARKTMNIVRMNLIFTAVYNIVGISLAAFGILPPILAAALQSIPDLGILGNSSRLLHQKLN